MTYLNYLMLVTIWVVVVNGPGEKIVGEYWTEGKKGKISIYKCEKAYCGSIIWREEARRDTENPNPDLRDRSVVGIEFMKGFTYDSSHRQWEGGTVYSIENGGTYRGKMWLEKDGKVLKMRGYIGISLLGKTAVLTRVE